MTNPASKFPVLQTLTRRRCLTAVASRDARLDSAFVYAVRSTGIYCRPSCPSRRPRPKQLQFFAIPEAAERAGFRPCLRCRPQQAPRSTQSELVHRVCSAIEAEVDRPADLRRLAGGRGMSAQHLQRTFRKAMGITPRQYADAIRVARLKSHLRKGTDVTTALYETGYGSASRLYEKSDAQLGMTPATYRRGGSGMQISYTIADCSLGRVLVAATNRGVSAIYLGTRTNRWPPRLARNIRTPRYAAARKGIPNGCARSSGTSPARSRSSICPLTWRLPRSSAASGRRCAPSRSARHVPIARWRARWDGPPPRAP